MQKYFRIVLVFLCLWAQQVKAQEFTGLNVGNYKGVDVVMANPSLALLQRSWLDVRIIGVGLFAENNFIYIPRTDFNLTDLFRKNYQFPRYGEYERPVLASEGSRLFHAFTENRVFLPAVLYANMSRRFSVALFVQSRVAGGAERIPYDIANFSYYGLDYSKQHRIEYNNFDISGSALAWSEIGSSMAIVLRRERFDLWTVGITFKYLLGHTGFYAKTENVRYVVLNDSTLDIRNLSGEVAYAIPLNYSTNSFPGGQPYVLGRGLGMDLGFTFLRTPRELKRLMPQKVCQPPFDDYIWRFGVSLLDIGSIHFRTNAQKHRIRNASYFWENVNELTYQTLQEAVNDVSIRLTGNPQGALIDSAFKLGLPTAISIQYDRKLEGRWYFFAGAVKGLPWFGDASIRRPDQLMLIPRYETQYFEVSFPFTMYRWVRPRLGLSVRFGTFTIGTDNLGGFIRQGNFKSADLYLSLRVSLRKGHCWYGKPKDPCYSTF